MVIEEFKSQVLNDYKLAYVGSLISKECVNVDCSGFDVAQVAMSKFVQPMDRHLCRDVDVTYSLASGESDVRRLLSQLKKANSVCSDFTDVSLKLAKAMAKGRDVKQNTYGIIVTTLYGEDFLAGESLHLLLSSCRERLPLSMVVWNNLSDMKNVAMLKVFSGFSQMRRGDKTLNMQSVKSTDYPALCRTFEQQFELTRNSGVPSITFVEKAGDDIVSFASWMNEKKIAEPGVFKAVEEACQEAVSSQKE
ncbi:MAG: hypothetical protein HUJ96_10950 [Marinilabiliaceae bacterium]|nr:hypothetical protein [Marinilabiliaceae bacterium]